MKQLDPIDVAWAAGFFEGEGCFGKPVHNSRSLHLDASQATREPLERLVAIFGGKIYDRPLTRSGKDFWSWRLFGLDAVNAIAAMYPQLSARRQAQAREALALHLERQAARIGRITHCKRGHLRSSHGARTRRGDLYCRRCMRDDTQKRRAEVSV